MPALQVPDQTTFAGDPKYTYTLYEAQMVQRLALPLGGLCLVQVPAVYLFYGAAGAWLAVTHLVAAALLFCLHRALTTGRLDTRHARQAGMACALLPFLAVVPAAGDGQAQLVTFYAVFCAVAGGGILFSLQRFTLLLAVVLTVWMALILPVLPPAAWPQHGGPVIGAVALGAVFIFARRRTCTYLHTLHVHQEVERAADTFNRDLFTSMEQSDTAVMIVSRDGRIEYANLGFTKLTGYEAAESLGRSPAYLLADPAGPNPAVTAPPRRGWKGDLKCRHKTGRMYWAHVSTTPILADNGHVLRYCCVAADVTQMKIAHHEMEHLAFHDNLTGLKNRRLFLDRLHQAMCESRRTGDEQALLFLDLDRFKQINDTYGHDAGDTLLKTVAQRLTHLVRAEDTVARLGGDEFVVLLRRVEGPHAPARVAQKILRRITEPVSLGDTSVTVSTSIGIALVPGDGTRPEQLLQHADAAMYQAKAQGRNRFLFYAPHLNRDRRRKGDLEAALRRALAHEEFLLFFQPRVDMRTRRICGSEVLLRWNHPESGLLSPDAFMDTLDQMDLAVPVNHWVLRRTGAYLADLRERGITDLTTSINLGTRQLLDPDLPSVVAEILADCHIPARLLEFEMREAVLSECLDQAGDILARLKALGVRLVLDNYGTGKLSPACLADLHLDLIKVDRSYVQALPTSSHCVSVTSAMIAMAHELNLQVVAGGVENDEQLSVLGRQHCDFAQGYLFYKPLPMEDLTALYHDLQPGLAG